MIEVVDLTKSYGPIEALRGISFDVAPGEIVGLLGPNGAGKSTAIKILTGYLQPDSGTVQVNGLDVLTHTREVQADIGRLEGIEGNAYLAGLAAAQFRLFTKTEPDKKLMRKIASAKL